MKVFDVLTESEQKVDEGPLRFAKRTLFKNTTMGKKAQISAEIDAEAKKVYKDLVAAISNYNDPRMTVKNVSDYLTGAGFVSGTKEVEKALIANPTFMNRLEKVKAAAGEKIATAKDKVSTAASNIKKRLSPDQTNIDKDSNPSKESLENLYYEAVMLNEIQSDMVLSKGEVYNTIKGFVKRGRQAKVATGDFTTKSGYGDAPKKDSKSSEKKTDSSDIINKEFASAVSIIKKAGFQVVDKEGKPVKV